MDIKTSSPTHQQRIASALQSAGFEVTTPKPRLAGKPRVQIANVTTEQERGRVLQIAREVDPAAWPA